MRVAVWSLRRAIACVALLLAILCVAAGFGTPEAEAAQVAGPVSVPTPATVAHPRVTLSAPVSGAAAVRALGADLDGIAGAYGMAGPELARRLKRDRFLTVDPQGWLYYVDPAPAVQAAQASDSTGSGMATLDPTIALPETFQLHSCPGANRVIYLDFDGHVLRGTMWNTVYAGGADIVCPAFDIDGMPGSFSDEELVRIQSMWRRVAEDYAPFAVDVTTEFPGDAALTRSETADQAYGIRALVSPISSYFGLCGGIAYVGIFDMVGDRFKPALVFPEAFDNDEKYIAEAVSHEVGHTLALYHDGTTVGDEYYYGDGSGETSWAPIMGCGYGCNLTQWSRGEYADADNLEDDLAILSAPSRLPYRQDDHGDDLETATPLAAGESPSVSGFIGHSGDVDVFAVTSGEGTLRVSAAPAVLGPNLDVMIQLRDAQGALVASSNPVDELGASLSVAVAQGTYYVMVDGAGLGDPLAGGYSDYASLGAYRLSASVPASSTELAPVAVAQVSCVSGAAPFTVEVSGTNSYDPEGSVLSYTWDFGDGSGEVSGSTASHTYLEAGDFVATLTVSDDSGLTGVAQVAISVSENAAPTAVLALSAAENGTAPLLVSFCGEDSRDTDGSIVSYEWSFGDGATDTAETTTHTYAAAGRYVASLVVTDDKGAKSAAQAEVVVQKSADKVLYVKPVVVRVMQVRGGWQAQAIVSIVDGAGNPVPRAAVKGSFSGVVSGSVSGTTSDAGTVTLVSKRYTKSGQPDFAITSVTKKGWVGWDYLLAAAATESVLPAGDAGPAGLMR